MSSTKVNVAVNGYGVIGKRVAEAVRLQDDMQLVGVADIATDYRIKAAMQRGPATVLMILGRRIHPSPMKTTSTMILATKKPAPTPPPESLSVSLAATSGCMRWIFASR